jgi:hypothetical protein
VRWTLIREIKQVRNPKERLPTFNAVKESLLMRNFVIFVGAKQAMRNKFLLMPVQFFLLAFLSFAGRMLFFYQYSKTRHHEYVK